jgi:hypothetical protein
MDEEIMRTAQAAAADMPLSAERIEGHLEGIRRLDEAARWVRSQPLGFEEPAFLFNALVGPRS